MLLSLTLSILGLASGQASNLGFQPAANSLPNPSCRLATELNLADGTLLDSSLSLDLSALGLSSKLNSLNGLELAPLFSSGLAA